LLLSAFSAAIWAAADVISQENEDTASEDTPDGETLDGETPDGEVPDAVIPDDGQVDTLPPEPSAEPEINPIAPLEPETSP